jgi:hypothetical protein
MENDAMRRLLALIVPLAIAAHIACRHGAGGSMLPSSLTDDDFWSLSTRLSEPAGSFTHSENLVSNEIGYVHLLRLLRPAGGVFIGVGPEQNFSYVATLRPAVAFIVDIRRENRNLHLMYKALFELSGDRADFVSRLFSRERPPGVGAMTPVRDLFEAYQSVAPSRALFEANARRIRERLLETHGFPLEAQDLEWVDHTLRAFHTDGPNVHYARSHPDDPPTPSYQALMTATDARGESRSFLASEEGFAFVKDLQATNRIVPVVGDFAGADALKRVGDYVRQQGSGVTAFYGSNVEVYLNREQMAAFCGNLARLPHDSQSWYIGSKGMQRLPVKLKSCPGARPGS